MLRWGARSSAVCCLRPSRRCFWCRSCSRRSTGTWLERRRTGRPRRKTPDVSEERHAKLGIQAPLATGPGVFANRTRVMRAGRRFVVLTLLVLLVAGGVILAARGMRSRDLDAAAGAQSRVYVNVVHPKSGGAQDQLELPGTLRG